VEWQAVYAQEISAAASCFDTIVRETCPEREIMAGVTLHDLLYAISLQHDLKIYTTFKI